MEVVPMSPNSSCGSLALPFNRRNVEEWSRVDRRTGFKETAKIETDSWAAKTYNAAHKYGKVVDSREVNNVDGSLQQRQRKQMEYYETQVPGGSMQVVRTVTSSSSKRTDFHFDDLQLPVNSLDLSTQKMKASVGRSGSIGSRRPPSRPRSFVERARIFSDETQRSFFNSESCKQEEDDPDSQVTIEEITDNDEKHSSLSRKKSNSSENIHKENDFMSRTSKIRRSLQFSKQNDKEEEDFWASSLPLRERAARIESLLRDSSSWSNPNKDKITISSIRRNSFKEEKHLETKSEIDDGIGVDPIPSVKLEAMFTPDVRVNGTGSLESRTNKNGVNSNRSEDWYNRRKSYGFESVHKESNILNKTSQIESSTDSGICRSSEVINPAPAWVKIIEQRNSLNEKSSHSELTQQIDPIDNKPKRYNFTTWNDKPTKTNHTSIFIVPKTRGSLTNGFVENSQKPNLSAEENDETEKAWNRKSPLPVQKNNIRDNLKTTLQSAKNPWISQLSGTKLAQKMWGTENGWSQEDEQNEELKYNNEPKENGCKTDEEDLIQRKKRVEFSKTEVHFAAESGRLNIVETDGKPPSTNMFRRRRKSTNDKTPTESTLPTLKFGETPAEKETITKRNEKISEKIEAELQELTKLVIEALPPKLDEKDHEEITFKNATILPKLVESEEFLSNSDRFDEQRPRSILKNFRKSFILGEVPERNVSKTENKPGPIWKSTVVLKNNTFGTSTDSKQYSSDGETEFQACLRNLKRSENAIKPANVGDVGLKRRSIPDESLLTSTSRSKDSVQVIIDDRPLLSVAERVKQVEELKTKNYSTKIHLGAGETRVIREPEETEKVTNKIWIPPVSQPQQITKEVEEKESTLWSFTSTRNNNSYEKEAYTKPEVSDVSSRVWLRQRQPESYSGLLDSSKRRQDLTKRAEATRTHTSDALTSLNPVVMPTKAVEMKTTIAIKCSPIQYAKVTNAEPEPETIKSSKPVCEMVSRFNSLSKINKKLKEPERRRTVPVNFKTTKTKEYTQSDLEEELKTFTENLDKDFKNIYEEEIESLRAKSKLSSSKQNLVIDKCIEELDRASRRGYDSGEDSDIAADHEVRSYMSTGHDSESDSEEERKIYTSWNKRAAFKSLQQQFKTVSLSKRTTESTKAELTHSAHLNNYLLNGKVKATQTPTQARVASISLRYEDDPLFTKLTPSGSVSSIDSNSSRPRVSYLNCPSLSEKYSKLSRSTVEPRRVHSDDAASDQFISGRRFSDISLDRLSDITSNRDLPRRSYPISTKPMFLQDKPTFLQDKALLESRKKISAIRAKLEGSISDLNGSDSKSIDESIQSSDDEKRSRRVISSERILDTISEGKKLSQVTRSNVCKKYHSSASSLDSMTGPIIEKVKPSSRSRATGTRLSSKCERLSQRASSREAILQHSSSEDISGAENFIGKRPRKPRANGVQEGSRKVKVERKPSIKEEKSTKTDERKSESTRRVVRVHRTRSSEMKRNKIESSSKGSTQKTDGDPSRVQKVSKEFKNSSTRTSQLRESASHKSSVEGSKSSKLGFNRFMR